MRIPQISLATLIAATLTLGACGQKGPLYLPQDPATPGAAGPAGTHSHSQPSATRDGEKQNNTTTEQQTQQHTEAEAVAK